MIFRMATAAILDFPKFEVLTVNPLSGTNMRHRVKFHQNWSHGCRDMAIWRFSKWRPSATLDFWNSNVLTVGAVKRPIWHHRTKFRKDRPNHCGDIAIFVIFKMAAYSILDLLGAIETTCDDHLVVDIVVWNLVKIDAVGSIIWNFQYFARLAWRRLITPPKLGFSGYFTPKKGININ